VASNVGAELNALRARQGSTSTGAAAASSVQQQNLNDVIGKLQTVLDTHRDPSLSVLAPAQAPGSASGAPRWLIILLAALAGLALGSVAALAIEYFNRRIRDARDVQAVFPEPILAGIPKVGARRTRLRRGRRALSPLDMPPQAFEQMRLLRTQLLAPAYGRVIMVTSADAGDGKTSVAAALAGAFSEGGRDVILLDADVLKPDAATVFGLPGANQDAEPADATTSLADLLVHVPGLPHVEVLRSPPGDMASLEMLISRLPELIDEATQLADRVIVDTPPVVEVSDSLRIAPECDSVVVVVRPRHTDRSRLALARDKLLRTGANVVGTVLVGESVVKLADTYYSYGYGYAPQQGKDEPAAEKSGASRRRAGEAVPNGAAPQPRVLHPDRP
jgi:Mrp family chromosome partitioning ATPase